MVRKSTHVFKAEIRDSDDHYSDDDGSDPEFNIIQDDFPASWTSMDAIRVYVRDDHNQAIDVDVEHTGPGDTEYEAVSSNKTISIESGKDGGTAYLDGPVGNMRFRFYGIASAPTEGSITVTVLGLGRE